MATMVGVRGSGIASREETPGGMIWAYPSRAQDRASADTDWLGQGKTRADTDHAVSARPAPVVRTAKIAPADTAARCRHDRARAPDFKAEVPPREIDGGKERILDAVLPRCCPDV